MFANVTTWLISDIARKSDSLEAFLQSWRPDGYRQFFREAAPKVVPLLRAHGLISSYAIRTQIDVITIVSIFKDEAGAEAGWDLISGHLHDIMDGTLEFLERTCGPVEDLYQLGRVGTGNYA